MEEKNCIDTLKINIRSVLISSPKAKTVWQLLSEYEMLIGEPLKIPSNFNSPMHFLYSLTDTIRVMGNLGMKSEVQLIQSDKSAHIAKLVDQQKPSKGRGSQGPRRTIVTKEVPKYRTKEPEIHKKVLGEQNHQQAILLTSNSSNPNEPKSSYAGHSPSVSAEKAVPQKSSETKFNTPAQLNGAMLPVKKEKVSTSEKILKNEKVPNNDKISKNEKVPNNDKISKNDKVPNNDKIFKNEKVPNNDKIFKNEKLSNSEKVVKSEKKMTLGMTYMQPADSKREPYFDYDKDMDYHEKAEKWLNVLPVNNDVWPVEPPKETYDKKKSTVSSAQRTAYCPFPDQEDTMIDDQLDPSNVDDCKENNTVALLFNSYSPVPVAIQKRFYQVMKYHKEGIKVDNFFTVYNSLFDDLETYDARYIGQRFGYTSNMDMFKSLPSIFRILRISLTEYKLFDSSSKLCQEEINIQLLDQNLKTVPEDVYNKIEELVKLNTLLENKGIPLSSMEQRYLDKYGVPLLPRRYHFKDVNEMFVRADEKWFLLVKEKDEYIVKLKRVKKVIEVPVLSRNCPLLTHFIPTWSVQPTFNYIYKDFLSTFTAGSFVTINVGEVFNPHKFYISACDEQPKLEELFSEMKELYETKSEDIGSSHMDRRVSVPGVCAAYHFRQEGWCRVRIKQATSRKAKVFVTCVDIGTVLCVPRQDLHYLHEEVANKPVSLVKARLAGISPKGFNWAQSASEVEKITKPGKYLAYVHDYDPKKFIVTVSLLDEKTRRNVAISLIDSGLATKHGEIYDWQNEEKSVVNLPPIESKTVVVPKDESPSNTYTQIFDENNPPFNPSSNLLEQESTSSMRNYVEKNSADELEGTAAAGTSYSRSCLDGESSIPLRTPLNGFVPPPHYPGPPHPPPGFNFPPRFPNPPLYVPKCSLYHPFYRFQNWPQRHSNYRPIYDFHPPVPYYDPSNGARLMALNCMSQHPLFSFSPLSNPSLSRRMAGQWSSSYTAQTSPPPPYMDGQSTSMPSGSNVYNANARVSSESPNIVRIPFLHDKIHLIRFMDTLYFCQEELDSFFKLSEDCNSKDLVNCPFVPTKEQFPKLYEVLSFFNIKGVPRDSNMFIAEVHLLPIHLVLMYLESRLVEVPSTLPYELINIWSKVQEGEEN